MAPPAGPGRLRPADRCPSHRAGLPQPGQRDVVHRPRSRAAVRTSAFHEPDGRVQSSARVHVLHGRDEIGRTDPVLLSDRVEGPRLLLLAGRSWRVTWTDWKRRRCFVEPFAEGGGRARWLSAGVGGLSFDIARMMREVLLGADPAVTLTRRGAGVL